MINFYLKIYFKIKINKKKFCLMKVLRFKKSEICIMFSCFKSFKNNKKKIYRIYVLQKFYKISSHKVSHKQVFSKNYLSIKTIIIKIIF